MNLRDAVVLGATVRRLRTQSEITQTRLAAQVGISIGHLSRFERGERPVNAATYAKLLTALDDIAREQRVGAA